MRNKPISCNYFFFLILILKIIKVCVLDLNRNNDNYRYIRTLSLSHTHTHTHTHTYSLTQSSTTTATTDWQPSRPKAIKITIKWKTKLIKKNLRIVRSTCLFSTKTSWSWYICSFVSIQFHFRSSSYFQ